MATVSEALQIAVGLHQRGDFAQAGKIYQDIIAAAPMTADAWHLLGLLLHQTGQNPDGIACIRAAIQRDRSCGNYYDSLGSAYRALPDAALAAASHRLAIALEPGDRKPYANLGNALRDRGATGAAEGAYRRAARLAPAHGAALVPLAACLTALGRAGEAARLHRIGVALAPGLSPALDAWAQACLAGGDPVLAERMQERLNAAIPGDPERIHALGLAKLTASKLPLAHLSEAARLVDRGRVHAALDLFHAAGFRHGHGNARSNYFGTALLAIQSGVLDGPALDSVAAAALPHLADDPGDIDAVAVVCYALYRRDKLAVASRFFRKFNRHPPLAGKADAFERFWAMVQGENRFFAALAADEPRLFQRRTHHPLAPPRPDGGAPIVLVGCDEAYWRRFGPQFLASWEERAPSCALHVHLINPSEDTRVELMRLNAATPARLSASCEVFDAAGLSGYQRVTYYTCARFAVAERLLREAGVPVVQVDVDATFAVDPGAAMAAWPGWDVSIMRDGRGRGPMRDFLAGFMAFNATDGGRGFLGLVLRYIGWHFDRGLVFWGLDQAAPYCVFDHLRRTGRAPATVWHDFEGFPFLDFLKK